VCLLWLCMNVSSTNLFSDHRLCVVHKHRAGQTALPFCVAVGDGSTHLWLAHSQGPVQIPDLARFSDQFPHCNIKTDLTAAPDLRSGQDPGCALAKGEWIHHRQRHRTAKQSGLHDACEPHTTDDQRISLWMTHSCTTEEETCITSTDNKTH
jgi:hypothetical protein